MRKETMSKSAFSAKVFAIYLFVVSSVLVIAPNFLLSMFRIAPTTEVWTRVVGVIAFNLGVALRTDAHSIGPDLAGRHG